MEFVQHPGFDLTMMASQKLPNYFVGVYAYLRVLHLGLFEISLCSFICLAITLDEFLRVHQP